MKKKMEDKIIDIIFIVGLGIAGYFIAQQFVPVLTEGTKLLVQDAAQLPISDERTTKFFYLTITILTISSVLMGFIEVANGGTFVSPYIEPTIGLFAEIFNSIDWNLFLNIGEVVKDIDANAIITDRTKLYDSFVLPIIDQEFFKPYSLWPLPSLTINLHMTPLEELQQIKQLQLLQEFEQLLQEVASQGKSVKV